VYKPHKANARGRFSNGGGSIPGDHHGDDSFDGTDNFVNIKNIGYGGMANNSLIMMDK